ARATRAAGTARTLAARSAAAARVARDAANSAAAHAIKAADAADEAAAHAGEAVEYAKRSTEYANAAVAAANTAAAAVKEAQEVEKAARDAETARIAEDTELGVLIARTRAQAETDDAAKAYQQRTQADMTSSEIKDLISAAETALNGGDTATAVATGRKAAVHLLDATGSWTREAAEYALSGNDEDIVNWVGTDRLLAQRQDDRENVAAISSVATAKVAQAAYTVLADDSPTAAGDFLATGVVEAAAEDNRVLVFQILNANPGPAVKAKAEAALADGRALALHRFVNLELAGATKEDDSVEIFRLLNTGGPYMKSAAQIVLEGSARMRRAFVVRDKFNVARLDQDQATHVAAIRASIAHAAKVAAKALQDAALASKAAAEARQAAAEATEWAQKANNYAKDAENSAAEARANADEADRSATAAAKSAKDALSAAASARGAARSANYSMRQAVSSARQAVNSAASAQASATAAAASAAQAGKDKVAAAAAASEARAIVATKRRAEAAEAARAAAEKARQNAQNGTNPSQTADNDDGTGDTDYWGMWPEDMSDAKDWAKATGHWSTVFGGAGVVLGILGAFPTPFSLPLLGLASGASLTSWGLQGVSTIFAGFGYGWNSSEFHQALGITALGGVFFAKGQIFKKFGAGDEFGALAENLGAKISNAASDVTTTVIGWVTW
ncbi:ALF repeat-containing protein, partial [Streptomyces sp. WI04-05A]|nr:ALF repeat-containing protein [Streptomyces sp. WI04-05A]MDX3753781.1 ALF repeat-containing protein [Streptomyces sp. AK08-02]